MATVQTFTFASSSGDRLQTRGVRVQAGGQRYVITLDWIPLADEGAGFWAFTLGTTDGTRIVSGAPLRDRTDVMAGVVHPLRPPGAIIAYNPTERSDPRRYGFQSEGWSLLYLPDGFNASDFALQTFPS